MSSLNDWISYEINQKLMMITQYYRDGDITLIFMSTQYEVMSGKNEDWRNVKR